MTTLEAQNEVITNLILENQKLERERDKLMEDVRKLQDSKQKHEHEELVAAQENDRLKIERDEAREALKKIKHIFINGGDTYVDFVKVGNIATDYLEGYWAEQLIDVCKTTSIISDEQISLDLPEKYKSEFEEFMRGKTCPILENGQRGVYSRDFEQYLRTDSR